MRLRVLVPAAVALECSATAISAVSERGAFCLLPRHRDCVTNLAPGVLAAKGGDGLEQYFAIDGGTLMKCGSDVMISTPRFVGPAPLGALKETVQHHFRILDERERKARSTMMKLEASLARRLLELRRHATT